MRVSLLVASGSWPGSVVVGRVRRPVEGRGEEGFALECGSFAGALDSWLSQVNGGRYVQPCFVPKSVFRLSAQGLPERERAS